MYLLDRQRVEADSKKPAQPDHSPKPDHTWKHTYKYTHTHTLQDTMNTCQSKNNTNL